MLSHNPDTAKADAAAKQNGSPAEVVSESTDQE
jgi:hypothetical protein